MGLTALYSKTSLSDSLKVRLYSKQNPDIRGILSLHTKLGDHEVTFELHWFIEKL